MQCFGLQTCHLNITFAIILLSTLIVGNGTKTEFCECANVTLFTSIPNGTLYLQPLPPNENCTKQEVIAVLPNNTRTCLNPHALAVRVFFNRLFLRISKNEEGLYEVVDTQLELPAWNITRKYYKRYLQKKVNSENAKILSRMIL
ncbi:protein UL147 [Cynomolgus macaque cytomegalovirus strain Ottawa]|uniref:Protein UL147 n=1 Tax=macacine betaherpesvirus 8 TaxID=2560567 RepID=G8H0S0_9BETA|nr:protein UL147 [Cynomolgus macaque cytomegalovirus strain Ottawa]AEQ32268.1 protein UL147 [Cynomolgus macaque cytomegalovirus strain Ottawa]